MAGGEGAGLEGLQELIILQPEPRVQAAGQVLHQQPCFSDVERFRLLALVPIAVRLAAKDVLNAAAVCQPCQCMRSCSVQLYSAVASNIAKSEANLNLLLAGWGGEQRGCPDWLRECSCCTPLLAWGG